MVFLHTKGREEAAPSPVSYLCLFEQILAHLCIFMCATMGISHCFVTVFSQLGQVQVTLLVNAPGVLRAHSNAFGSAKLPDVLCPHAQEEPYVSLFYNEGTACLAYNLHSHPPLVQD